MTTATARSRRGMAAHRRGRLAETLAVLALRLKGYAILERRLRGVKGSGVGEIDLVARKGGTLAFIEVKARPSGEQAAEAVLARQRWRLVRAARAFLGRRPDLAQCTLRFDAMLVRPWSWPRHLIDAWREGD